MDSLEQALTNLIELRRRQSSVSGRLEVPIIGEINPGAETEAVKRTITNAIAAQIRWDTEKPPFLPPLPLSLAEIEKLRNTKFNKSGDEWLHVLAYFAFSWRAADWDPEHPSFDKFTSALLDSPRVPWHLHMSAALSKIQRQPLAGFNDETFCWEKTFFERKLEKIMAKLETPARVETGLVRR
jgi:hypothetical protein